MGDNQLFVPLYGLMQGSSGVPSYTESLWAKKLVKTKWKIEGVSIFLLDYLEICL